MPRIIWLSLMIVTMLAAIANFQKFSVRPSQPKGFRECRAADAAQLAQRVNQETGQAQQRDQEAYVWSLLESAQRKEAHDAAAALLPTRPASTGYDSSYVKRLRQLACAELMHDCAPDMLITLHHLYDYDVRHLPAGDQQIYRDCNNVGLACFLVGQGTIDDDYRHGLLKQADQWLKKAESGFPNSAHSDLISIKENQLMVAEALQNPAQADDCRKQIDSLLIQLDGPAPRVTL